MDRSDIASLLSLGPLNLSDDEKGPLGLTTLFEPPPPVTPTVDIVLIHGLGGGSRKTWSYSSNPTQYWPLAWLPADNEFADVRIHTFGYKADWDSRQQSILNIRDFAQSLLGELRNHPGIRRTCSRVILVGHSMGGCVAKMVYILARQDRTAADLASRIHSIFFLGTPHRGSEMAAVLENILTVSWGKKPFVTDLVPNSAALSSINDSFRHLAPDLRLWSFYETLPVRAAGIANRIVVERHSATLGYHNEEIAGMDADHRHVCKFLSTSDPNYKILRNALVTAIDMIRAIEPLLPATVAPVGHGDHGTHVTHGIPASISATEAAPLLRAFLGIREPHEADLATLQVLKQPGSCRWFTDGESFNSWKDGTSPGILWLVGKPAAGKSVIAGHVVEHLGAEQTFCSNFIFKHAKTGKSTLSDCFKLLAFQMGMQDSSMRTALLRLSCDDLTWDKTDDASVWRRLFTDTLFQQPSIAQHYWVMDGIDECANFHSLFAKKYLSGFPMGLRLFATSRRLEEIERRVAGLGPQQASIQVLSDVDTLDDMRLFLETRLTELGRFDSDEELNEMCENVLQKSSGSFLWTRLVVQEFENTWTEEAMEAVLRDVPADLYELYLRMLRSVEQDDRKLTLARSILTWVVLASRPLTVEELRCAVKMDINQTLQNVSKAIPGLCGQLVFVDQDDKVHMIHETAREFLLSEDTGDRPLVVKKEGHTHAASLLLRYLTSGVLNPHQPHAQQSVGRTRGFAKSSTSAPFIDTSLVDYASSFFCEHLYRATSENNQLMCDLHRFLETNTVLSWIEHVAKSADLADVTRTATNMREWLVRRTKYVPPTDAQVQVVDSWITDLIRVAAKFCQQLLTCPSSIHCLIPPLCPPESIIRRTFNKDAGRASSASSGMVVDGLPPGSWDDCLVRLDFQKGQTTTISGGIRFFAVGLSTGQISLYDSTTLQSLLRMTHPERVRLLEFSPDDASMASCGTKNLVIWDPKSGTMTHMFPLRSPPLGIHFLNADELICAFQSSELTKWYVAYLARRSLPSLTCLCLVLQGTPDRGERFVILEGC